MERNLKIKPAAILFDMDGVLVDSLDAWWESLNTALKNFNKEEISRGEFIEKFWGHDLFNNLKKLRLNENIGIFCNNIYINHVNVIKIFPNTIDTLKKLKYYKKAVITNTPKDCALQILKKFEIEKYFNIIITSDEVENGKPAPDIVFKACNNLRVKPSEAVLIGDTESDMKAGRAAGCKVIGIKVDGDFSINTISELTNIIDS